MGGIMEKPTESQLRIIECICQSLHIDMVDIKTKEEAKKWLLAHQYEEERVRDIAM